MSVPFFQEDVPGQARYPQVAGHKVRDTSLAAAQAIEPAAVGLRERVLAAIRELPRTPEEVAVALGVPLMNVRPRCSELAAQAKITDSGERRKASGGRQAIVWRVMG